MMSRRSVVVKRFRPGDLVVRRHRLLKTQGTVLRFGGEDHNGASRVWVKWSHPDTLPNPSLEAVDDLELVDGAVSEP
jgi:hypothetical protein